MTLCILDRDAFSRLSISSTSSPRAVPSFSTFTDMSWMRCFSCAIPDACSPAAASPGASWRPLSCGISASPSSLQRSSRADDGSDFCGLSSMWTLSCVREGWAARLRSFRSRSMAACKPCMEALCSAPCSRTSCSHALTLRSKDSSPALRSPDSRPRPSHRAPSSGRNESRDSARTSSLGTIRDERPASPSSRCRASSSRPSLSCWSSSSKRSSIASRRSLSPLSSLSLSSRVCFT
mmetsp:Transcript_36700/g.103564  ORF Transcript_36700/g.103564 Transcript_36700/m.103564 type:complete len:236 (-) Transcript_36700:213-920(-)